ncbi:Protein lon-1 [Aphelenchoides bicaudatus]|nr:Protein lon-1 [Aphelenchoides bicaudatus]
MMINGRLLTCRQVLLLLPIFTYCLLLARAFEIHPRIHSSVISHSGPTNALYGHEQFHDEPLSSEQRQKRNAMWGNNYFYQNNGWPNMLVSSEPPAGYMTNQLSGEHNRYRRMVPATDMRMMYWSNELAASAQRHANRCDFRHSRDRVNIGENIWAAPYSNYSDALVRWFEEVWLFTRLQTLLRLVWARTNLVGCGYARCRDVWGVLGRGHQHILVCHYNPQGNKSPAFTWAYNRNQVCSQCPEDAPACYEGLCYMPENYNRNSTAVTGRQNAGGGSGNLWFNQRQTETNTISQNKVE